MALFRKVKEAMMEDAMKVMTLQAIQEVAPGSAMEKFVAALLRNGCPAKVIWASLDEVIADQKTKGSDSL